MRKHVGKIIYGVSALGVVIGFIHIDNELIKTRNDIYDLSYGRDLAKARREQDEGIYKYGSLWDKITWRI